MFRKLACRSVDVTKLFLVALAPAANQKVQAFFDSHNERHRLVHRENFIEAGEKPASIDISLDSSLVRDQLSSLI
jgi:hypothetical protein